jgi:predicted nucleic acid-binding Zn ribbon protein
MGFTPLNRVLNHIDQQTAARSRQIFQQILISWVDVVGRAVSAQTRPVTVQRRVLQVATSNSTWAQNLAFERQRLLAKLNQRLGLPEAEQLLDIRFSTAQWTRSPQPQSTLFEAQSIWQAHPSRVSDAPKPYQEEPPGDANTMFQRWADRMKARSRHLPLCPKCQCPTPAGELERWSVCGLCAAQQWKHSQPQGGIPPTASSESEDQHKH